MRILIVDDDEDLLEALGQLLELENDIDVVATALNGKNAVKLASSMKPDMVLMDIVMPVMDGVAAAQAIKQNRPEIRIVLMTGYEGSYDIRQLNIDGFLRKPDDVINVAEKMRSFYSSKH